MTTLAKMAWGLLLLLAAIVVLFVISPAGGRLLSVYPNTARALYAAAVLSLTAWASRVWMPLRKPTFDVQSLFVIAAFAVIGAFTSKPGEGAPLRTAVVGGGGIALLLGLTRRVQVGEISHIVETDESDPTVWVIPLPTRQFATRQGAARWGWKPLRVPTKMRIMAKKRTPARRDDRLFLLGEEPRFELVVRSATARPEGFKHRALIVIVDGGIFGRWLYVVGRPGMGLAGGSP